MFRRRKIKSKDVFTKHSLKTGDEVVILSGDEKGKTGKIMDFNRKNGKILVQGINLLTHFSKKSETEEGGLQKKEGWLPVSKVMFYLDGKKCRSDKIKREEK